MGPCDIKTSGQAYNDGLDAFSKAFKSTGGKPTESIRFALNEIKSKHPNLNFDPNTFADPIINALKEKGLVSKSYKFSSEKKTSIQKKAEKFVAKMNTLSDDQKKEFARKSFAKAESDGILSNDDVKNIYAQVVGLPAYDESFEAEIKANSEKRIAYKKVEDDIQLKIKEMQAAKTENGGKLTPEQDASFKKEFQSLRDKKDAARKEMLAANDKFSEKFIEKKFILHQITDYMPLNLMNPGSLEKNVSGAVVDAMIRTMSNIMSPIVNKVASKFTGINAAPIGARARGVAKAKSFSKGAEAFKYGATEFNNELPQPNYLKAGARWKKAMDDHGLEKFKGMLSAALKVHPMLISKALTAPDAIVFEQVKFAELNRIGEAKGLSGAELEAFLLSPDDKSYEVAITTAKNATFKQELPAWLSGLQKISNYDPHQRAKEIVANGKMSPLAAKLITSFRAIVQKSVMPFIKTPINIVRTSSKILLPEYQFAHDILMARNETDPIEKQRLISESTTKLAAGMFIRNIAVTMVAQGLISAGYSDEDKKTKDVVEQELGGPNRINLSALMRGLTFRDMKKKKGDINVDINSLGAFGIAMAAYAHAFNKYGKEELEMRTSYGKDLSNSISVPFNLAFSSLSSTLDFTFFTGINQLQSAIYNKGGYERDQLASQYIANIFTGVAPSTYQKLSTSYSEDVKKQFDKDKSFGDNLANILGYRFAFQSDDLKNKYFSLKESDKSAVKKKQSMLFDNYFGRVLEAEIDFLKLTKSKDDGPVKRLYDAIHSVDKEQRDELMPSSISKKISVPNGKGKLSSVELTQEQYDYIQGQASNYRMMIATPYIMSEDFKTHPHEVRAAVLKKLYNQGLSQAKEDLVDRYPEIKKGAKKTKSPGDVNKIAEKFLN